MHLPDIAELARLQRAGIGIDLPDGDSLVIGPDFLAHDLLVPDNPAACIGDGTPLPEFPAFDQRPLEHAHPEQAGGKDDGLAVLLPRGAEFASRRGLLELVVDDLLHLVGAGLGDAELHRVEVDAPHGLLHGHPLHLPHGKAVGNRVLRL